MTLPALSIQSLLAKHGSPDVAVLQVDVEGFDHRIVHMALDAECRPQIINYEHMHLPAADRVALTRRLRAEGYRFIQVGFDTLAALGLTGEYGDANVDAAA